MDSSNPLSRQALWMWLTFLGIVIALLVLDLGVLHKTDHEIGVGKA
jgi:tellurite resistance protein TerC